MDAEYLAMIRREIMKEDHPYEKLALWKKYQREDGYEPWPDRPYEIPQ